MLPLDLPSDGYASQATRAAHGPATRGTECRAPRPRAPHRCRAAAYRLEHDQARRAPTAAPPATPQQQLAPGGQLEAVEPAPPPNGSRRQRRRRRGESRASCHEQGGRRRRGGCQRWPWSRIGGRLEGCRADWRRLLARSQSRRRRRRGGAAAQRQWARSGRPPPCERATEATVWQAPRPPRGSSRPSPVAVRPMERRPPPPPPQVPRAPWTCRLRRPRHMVTHGSVARRYGRCGLHGRWRARGKRQRAWLDAHRRVSPEPSAAERRSPGEGSSA